MRGVDSEGEGHWWLRDKLSQKIYDLTFDQFENCKKRQSVYKTGIPSGYFGSGEMPDSKFFSLIQKIQPNSKRWTTDLLSIYRDFGFKTKLKVMERQNKNA